MATQQLQSKEEKVTEKEEEPRPREGKALSSEDHKRPTAATNPTSSPPPSSSSSPSHEFSFTISLHPSTTPVEIDKCKPSTSSAVDLSPADDIFFHGHLLPLQILSHSSLSPRTSTTSLDSLNFPARNFPDYPRPTTSSATNTNHINNKAKNTSGTNGRTKTKSFSLFGLAKWRKGFEIGEGEEVKKKVRFDVSGILRRYARVVRPLMFFKEGKEKGEFRRQPHSFSGNVSSKWKELGERSGGLLSAPASMRTSPTNSGLLVATAKIPSSNDSTLEELQNAIQAAIAHCKNSVAAKEEQCTC